MENWWQIRIDVTANGKGILFEELPQKEQKRIMEQIYNGCVAGTVEEGPEETGEYDSEKMSEVLTWDITFRYQLLDRLRTDCEYYLGLGNRLCKYLWAGSVDEQIEYMKALWHSFPREGKPEWLSLGEICDYEKKMTEEAQRA